MIFGERTYPLGQTIVSHRNSLRKKQKLHPNIRTCNPLCMFETPISSPPPKQVPLYSHLFSLPPFFDFFPTSPHLPPREKKPRDFYSPSREREIPPIPSPLVVFAGESQQAGRQAETDQTGPDQSRQAGRSLPFFPPHHTLQRRRSIDWLGSSRARGREL